MEFSNYQNQAKRITHYIKSPSAIEIENRDQMLDNMGSILYAITMLCYDLDTTLETIALRNLAKLRKQQRIDSGDTRE